MTRRRVVITGLGAICAIGKTAPDAWAAAKAGTSGARRVTRFDPSALASQNACEVKDWDSEALFGRDAKKIDLFTEFAIVAADEAVKDSGVDLDQTVRDRCGVTRYVACACYAASGAGYRLFHSGTR